MDKLYGHTNATNALPSPYGSGVGYATTACDPVESSPARNQISQAEQLLSDLHNAIDRLEQRLDTILTPIPPDVNKNGPSPTPTMPKSHVVGRLELLNEGFMHVGSRIERLKTWIEL